MCDSHWQFRTQKHKPIKMRIHLKGLGQETRSWSICLTFCTDNLYLIQSGANSDASWWLISVFDWPLSVPWSCSCCWFSLQRLQNCGRATCLSQQRDEIHLAACPGFVCQLTRPAEAEVGLQTRQLGPAVHPRCTERNKNRQYVTSNKIRYVKSTDSFFWCPAPKFRLNVLYLNQYFNIDFYFHVKIFTLKWRIKSICIYFILNDTADSWVSTKRKKKLFFLVTFLDLIRW